MKPLADVLFGRCQARNEGVIMYTGYHDKLNKYRNYALVKYFVSLIGILMEVSILFSILDRPGRRGRLILFPTELKAADM